MHQKKSVLLIVIQFWDLLVIGCPLDWLLFVKREETRPVSQHFNDSGFVPDIDTPLGIVSQSTVAVGRCNTMLLLASRSFPFHVRVLIKL